MLNLRREFDVLKLKEIEIVKNYADRLMKLVNQIRLLGEELPDSRVVEKVLVSLPKRFAIKISSLEDSRDLSQITLSELVNSLQVIEQRRAIRYEETIEGELQAKQSFKQNKASSNNQATTKTSKKYLSHIFFSY